ncbi:MAG: hypothetical protein ACP5TK_01090 [Candidatus Micrarchaeia archaeon]
MPESMEAMKDEHELVKRAIQLEKQLMPSPFLRLLRKNEVDFSKVKKELIDTMNAIMLDKDATLEYVEKHDLMRIRDLYGVDYNRLIDIYFKMDKIVMTPIPNLSVPEMISYYSVMLAYNDKNRQLAKEIVSMIVEKAKDMPEPERRHENHGFKRPPVVYPEYPNISGKHVKSY